MAECRRPPRTSQRLPEQVHVSSLGKLLSWLLVSHLRLGRELRYPILALLPGGD